MAGTITWWDAWRLWFSGQEVDTQLRLGPWSILWWGRVGKIASFLAGATVVLDLIGHERLRRIGETLPKPNPARNLGYFLVGENFELFDWRVTPDPTARLYKDGVPVPIKLSPRAKATSLVLAILSVPVTLTVLVLLPTSWWIDIILALPVYCVTFFVVGLIFSSVVATIVSIPAFLLLSVARTLASKTPGQALRYLALVLLVTGFHFDLLAS
ncbi:hypothetical protein [Pseudonocardia sp. T1-2H]|uniref:hypothetical protein n=1 Tax=Pseudonocardia sp. T1-2H TaxID=3128899 RepID=UPI003100F453